MLTVEEIDTIRAVAQRMDCQDDAAFIVVVNDRGTSMMLAGSESSVTELKKRMSRWFNDWKEGKK